MARETILTVKNFKVQIEKYVLKHPNQRHWLSCTRNPKVSTNFCDFMLISALEHPHQWMQIFHLFCIKKKKKTYFFYFTHLILQNTHINLSILHIYLIKYSLFYHFFYYFLHCLSLPLRPNHHHHHYLDRRTIQDQTNKRSENHWTSKTHSSWNPLNPKAKSSPTQPETHWSNNEK